MKKFLLLLALVLTFPFPPTAQAADGHAVAQANLTARDKKDLERIETYLNAMKNVSADFLQIDDAGGIMRGQIAIARPGKMRVTYDPPSKDFIIADGSSVHIWDEDLKAQTNVEQGSSLAEFILRDPVKLDGDVSVTKVQRFPAKIEVTLIQAKDPAQGSLILVFEDKPLRLRQWKVVDPQGRTTGINLENMSEKASFPSNYFVFTPPNFGKRS